MRKLSRRNALLGSAAIAATAASGSVATAVAAQPIEPLIELGRQWQEQVAIKHRIPLRAPEEEYEAQCCVVDDCELAIMNTTARSFAGLAVKLRLVVYLQEAEADCWAEKAVLSALHDADRLTGEGVS